MSYGLEPVPDHGRAPDLAGHDSPSEDAALRDRRVAWIGAPPAADIANRQGPGRHAVAGTRGPAREHRDLAARFAIAKRRGRRPIARTQRRAGGVDVRTGNARALRAIDPDDAAVLGPDPTPSAVGGGYPLRPAAAR